jgi:flagellin-like hook-associated protein FlgL
MSEQADIEAALARATAAYKIVSAERDALKDANDRAEAADEIDRLREALTEIANRGAPGDEARVLALAALAKVGR